MQWSPFDFIVIVALLLIGFGIFVLTTKRVHKKYRLLVGVAIVALFLYVWAELAVGVFTNIGS